MMPHQVEANEIALSFQPELKSHVSNVQRVLFRIVRDGGTAAEVAKRAHEMFDSVSQKLYQRMGEKADCKAGCAYCCCVVVQVHRHELELLVRELKAKLAIVDLAALKERIQVVIEERAKGNRPRCALLGTDDRCSVYAVRPMYCRSCNSPDANECKAYEIDGDETPRKTFALPMIFADYTQFAANTTINPKLTPHTYPQPDELMEALLKAL